MLISQKISLACLKQPLLTKKRGLSRKHLYMKGREPSKGVAIQKNKYLQLVRKFIRVKNIGAPAQTMVNMLTEIVLNRMAVVFNRNTYLRFRRCRCRR